MAQATGPQSWSCWHSETVLKIWPEEFIASFTYVPHRIKLGLMQAQPLRDCVPNQKNKLFWFGCYRCCCRSCFFPSSPALDPRTAYRCCTLNCHTPPLTPCPATALYLNFSFLGSTPVSPSPQPHASELTVATCTLRQRNQAPKAPTQWRMHPTILAVW